MVDRSLPAPHGAVFAHQPLPARAALPEAREGRTALDAALQVGEALLAHAALAELELLQLALLLLELAVALGQLRHLGEG